MKKEDWAGVFPAVTTPFHEDLSVDYSKLENHIAWLIESGCRGIVLLGSLGEAPTLERSEKVEIVRRAKQAIKDRVPLIAGISALSTAEAVSLAKDVHGNGGDGLMVLPPYVYRGDWGETKAHLTAIFDATPLPAMLYNNPIAYGTDINPAQILELSARHENFQAVKESSGDLRRITDLKHLAGERLVLFVGMDDVIVEGVAAGAKGWVAGLVNAFPGESVKLFELAQGGPSEALDRLYADFLPLLRLDTVPKFVQLIKFVQQEMHRGCAQVRPPRLELTVAERTNASALVHSFIGRNAA